MNSGHGCGKSLLSLKEVAEFADVSLRTATYWVERGQLEAIRFGPQLIRVTPEALLAFMESLSTFPKECAVCGQEAKEAKEEVGQEGIGGETDGGGSAGDARTEGRSEVSAYL